MTETISTRTSVIVFVLLWVSFTLGMLIGCFLGRER